MKHYYLFFYLLFMLLGPLTLSAQNFEWAKSYGDKNSDEGRDIAIDKHHNVYTVGNFKSKVDFNPGMDTFFISSSGGYDAFIQKLDANGNFLWAKGFGGTGTEYCYGVDIDQKGNVLVTGLFENTVDFDPGSAAFPLSSNGRVDAYIVKLDSNGNFIWAKSFGSNTSDYGFDIKTDKAGNIYTTGSFSSSVDFNPNAGNFVLSSNGSSDIFVQKLDSSGNFIWAKSMGGSYIDHPQALAIDPAYKVLITGRFHNTVDFNPGPGVSNLSSNGGYDNFVVKLDTAGNFEWANALGGSNFDNSTAIKTDNDGNVYTTGIFEGTVDFDPDTGKYLVSSTGNSNPDIYILKYDSLGRFVWVKTLNSSSEKFSAGLTVDASSNIYSTGYFLGSMDVDPDTSTYYLSSKVGYSIFLHKLDSQGNFVWASTVGGESGASSTAISITSTDELFVTGMFNDSSDFNPESESHYLKSNGSNDVFVLKLNQCKNTFETETITACNEFKWIDGITYTSSTDTATYVIPNTAGCDSIISLSLTINSVSDVTTTLNTHTITANNPNATYQWLNCENNYAPISGETNRNYTATQNGMYAVQLTENNCTDTSDCVTISDISIVDNSFGVNLKVFPNPINNVMTLDLGNVYHQITLTITDVTGSLIESKEYSRQQHLKVPFNAPTGMYIMRVTAEGKKATIRLIKE